MLVAYTHVYPAVLLIFFVKHHPLVWPSAVSWCPLASRSLPALNYCCSFYLSHSGMVVSLYGLTLHFLLACFLDILLPFVGVFCLFLIDRKELFISWKRARNVFQATPQSCYISRLFILTKFSDSCTLKFKANLIPNPYLPGVLLSPPIFCYDSFQTQGKIERILQWTSVYSSPWIYL